MTTSAITLADTTLNIGKTTTVTFTFNEAVANLASADIDLSNANGTLSAFSSANGGRTWTATFTPAADVQRDTDNTIRVVRSGIDPTSSAAYTVDTKRPTIDSITIADNKLSAGESTTITITFSESLNQSSFTLRPVDHNIQDLNVVDANATLPVVAGSRGTLSNLRTTDGKTWTVTLTAPTIGNTTDNSLAVVLDTLTDLAGNSGGGGNLNGRTVGGAHIARNLYSIDTTRPTVTITLADSTLTAGETTTVTFTFSEPVNGFTAEDIVLSNANGTLGTLTANASRTVWSATFTPTANVNDATNTISVNMTGVSDDAGNAGMGGNASSFNYTVDTRPAATPVLLADTTLTIGETTTVTFTFNEAVANLASADIDLSNANGTLSAFSSANGGRTWTATFTPAANVQRDTDNTIRVVRSGIDNTPSAVYTVDTVNPRIDSITIVDNKLSAGESTTITITFTEALKPSSFTILDLNITRSDGIVSGSSGTLSNLRTTDDGKTWKVTLTAPTIGNTTDNCLRILLYTVTDLAGNMADDGNFRRQVHLERNLYSIDTTRPTATITLADSTLTAGETTTVTFTFSEPVNGFTAEDIVLSNANGTLGTLTANANRTVWSATFTPTANVKDTTNTISVNLPGVSDDAGNAGMGGNASSFNYTVDTRPAAAPVLLADTTLTIGETTTVTFRFNEAVANLASTDIDLSNAHGTLGPLSSTDGGRTWTATFTPAADVQRDTDNTIRVVRSGIDPTSSAAYTVDTKRPTIDSITIADNKLSAGESTTITITFSESLNQSSFTLRPVDHNIQDLNVVNANATLPVVAGSRGTLSNLRTTDGKTWTVTLTAPTIGNTTDNSLAVVLDTLTDLAGNSGGGGNLNGRTVGGAHIARNLYSIDTTRPTATITLADSTLTAGETTTVTFTFSEPVNGFTAEDIVLSNANGTLGTLTANASRTVWSATFTPTANVNDATNTISVNMTGVSDDAGNAGVGSASSANYTVDTRPAADTAAPVLLSATVNGNILTLTYDEANTLDASSTVPGSAFEVLAYANIDVRVTGVTVNAAAKTVTLVLSRTIAGGETITLNYTKPTTGSNSAIQDQAGNDASGFTAQPVQNMIQDTTAPVLRSATVRNSYLAFNYTEAGSLDVINTAPASAFVVSSPGNAAITVNDVIVVGTTRTIILSLSRRVGGDETITLSYTKPTTGNNVIQDQSGNHAASFTNQAVRNLVDIAKPTATITLASSSLTVGETTTVTFTFSEPVNGFTVDDINLSNANGTLGTLTANASRTVWTATFTPTANVNDATNTISVNMTGVSDDAGNAGVGSATSANYTIDTATVRPRATITLADTTLTITKATTTVTFTFNERVNGFTADDIILTDANGTLGALTPVGTDGTTWTATFTPTTTATVEDSSNTIGVNLAGVTNVAGNAGVGNARSAAYTVDTQRPKIVSYWHDGRTLGIGKSTILTIRFSEEIDRSSLGLSHIDANLGVTCSDLRTTDGITWTFTLTAPTTTLAGGDGDGIARVQIYQITDVAGNGIGHSVTRASNSHVGISYTLDTRRPTVTVTLDDSTLTAGETTTVTFTFSEPVNGFTADDIGLSNANGTLGTLTANASRTVWTALFTPTANVNDATNTISVNMTGVSDDAGNAGVGSATSANYIVDTRDTTRPTATVTLADSTLTAGETTTVTFTFSEPVNGFTADDIGLSNANGTLGTLTANASRTVWTALFTPTANVNDATNTISVNMTGVSDDAGNAGVGSATSANYIVDTRDTTRPTATVTLADSTLTAGETTTVTFTFSEPVNGFTADDIGLSNANGTLGTLTANASRTVWTALFTPTANVNDATNTISVNMTGVSDDAGNAGVGSATSANYIVDTRDTTRPTATVTLADSTLTAGETTTVTFTFSEPVNGFTADDIGLSNANGTLGTLTANASRTVWTALFTPTANVNDATNTISVNMTGVSDDAGNAGVGSATSANYIVDTRDTTRPTATVTLADSTLTAGETTTVTFTFSEPVNGFTADDIGLSNANGTLGTLTANASRTVWTALFTPTANVNDATNTISVNMTGVSDDAGNAGVGSATSANYIVDTRDTTRPTATVTLADSTLTAGETTTVTFTFSEPVNGFTADDIGLSNANGTLGTLTANASRTVWTALFTPTANVNDATNTISVNMTGVSDDAGNAGVGSATSANYIVDTRDTTRPTATVTLADSTLTAGETTTVTFTFSEPVNGFTADDIGLSNANGTLGTLTANASRTVWTALFTPTANVNDATNTISVNMTGVSDDAGNAGVGSATSANYIVDTRDTTRPTATVTLADSTLTAGETTTVTFTFSEPVNGFTADDIGLSNANGTLGTLTANASRTVWTALFTPTANVNDATNTISVNMTGVSDDAGNAGVGSATSANYIVDTRDTTRPTATVTLADSTLTAGETTTVTFTFSEPVNGFTADDIGLSNANGTLGTLTANASRTVWTALFTPTANVNDATNTISVNMTGVSDDAGNAGVGSATSANYIVDTRDTTRPTATVTLADSTLTAGETTTVTFTFSEPVNGFTADDIGLSNANGTLGTLTANASRTVWTALFTPTANVNDATNTISVNMTGVSDDAGNAGVGSATSANYIVDTRDTTRPTATVTLADSTLTAGETTTVTFTFSEPVNGFTADDIDLSNANGTLGALTANASRTVWTALFTPTANVNDATNTISVNMTGVSDDAGNAGVGSATSANYIVDTRDTTRPTATVTLADSSLTVGETTTVTFTFSEPVNGFTADDIDLSNANGTLGALTANASRTVWTALFTPAANVNDATNTISVNMTGVTDVAGNAGVGSASSANFTIDTRPIDTRPVDTTAPTATVTPEPARVDLPTDSDKDSIPDVIENKVPGITRPDGTAPVVGDGNGDGIQDSTQAAVVSTSVVTGPRAESPPATAPSSPVTLVAGSQDGKLYPGSNAQFRSLIQKAAPDGLPDGLEMPIGLLSFSVTLTEGRNSETFSLYVDPALGVNGYWMQDNAGFWVNLASEPYGGKMQTEGGKLRLDFRIADGGQFDADGKADGSISAAGSAAYMPLSIVGQATTVAHGEFCF